MTPNGDFEFTRGKKGVGNVNFETYPLEELGLPILNHTLIK